jgi:hypothetical protein
MEELMPLTDREMEWAAKASRFIKVELKRANVSYKELADRLNEHGLEETEASISSKLQRGTFSVTFFLAVLTVLGIEALTLAAL